MLPGHERAMKVYGRISKRGTRGSPLAGTAKILERLVPHLTEKGMLRQPFDLVSSAIGVETLDEFDESAMKRAPALRK